MSTDALCVITVGSTARLAAYPERVYSEMRDARDEAASRKAASANRVLVGDYRLEVMEAGAAIPQASGAWWTVPKDVFAALWTIDTEIEGAE